ncbi:BQ5605_C137g13410 [Microbotryum silenes-dioicae]|uniref:BQ5605_C006g04163 protein n=1 Tax=Microbotryum silenes-dioicae TaxID=796604 RepID=A0A2X0MAA7_9BASI|nr:BQ5605_C006g04163 [Microbotryum silenes-dioicae]SGY88818.1 BQ5605_C137g13410 [Microbotryum silenes-dioicae]
MAKSRSTSLIVASNFRDARGGVRASEARGTRYVSKRAEDGSKDSSEVLQD